MGRCHQCPSPLRAHLALGLLVVMLLPACSAPRGIAAAGALPPPDGAQRAEALFDEINRVRQGVPLPPAPRDPALDELAGKGLRLIEDGVPDGVAVIDHLAAAAGLSAGLEYVVSFESGTPGIDDRTREIARRPSGVAILEPLLAADPALDGFGWAADGPWAVSILRSRPLGPADGPALEAALAAAIQQERPGLRPDLALEAIAVAAVFDVVRNDDDDDRFRGAGGVPVSVGYVQAGPQLPTLALNSTLEKEGPRTLREPWLSRVGVAAKISDAGTVMFVVLATGEADRSALAAELTAGEAKATELVNRARAEAGLPEVRLDPALVEAAKRWVADAARYGCYVGHDGNRGCPGAEPTAGNRWWFGQRTWASGEDAFVWNLAPADRGDEKFSRFGAAATLGPDGAVWAILVLGE